MLKLAAAAFLFLASALAPASAQWAGVFNPMLIGGAYIGPGDIVTGPTFWGGLRAYSLATAGTKSANICNAADANCADVNSLFITGKFDVATATGAPLNCGGTGGTCTIKTLYDKSGNAHDLSQATIGSRPTLVLNCIGSLPCMHGVTASSQVLAGTIPSGASPNTISIVMERTANFTTQSFGMSGDGPIGVFFTTSTNTVGTSAGSTVSATAADSAFHAVNAVLNGASSSLGIDGATTAGTAGTNSTGTNVALFVNYGVGGFLTGNIVEFGLWPFAFSAGQIASMNANQHSVWGF